MPDVKGAAQDMVDRAKGAVGKGGPPLATEVGGRVAAVREALQAFGEGDHERFLSAFDDDVEWIGPRGSNFPGPATQEGRQAVQDGFLATVGRSYASFGFKPEQYLQTESEDIVVVLGSFVGEGVKGQGDLDVPGAQVWEFKGERVGRVRTYTDSASFPPSVDEEEHEKGQRDEAEPDREKDKREEESSSSQEEDGPRSKGEQSEGTEQSEGSKESSEPRSEGAHEQAHAEDSGGSANGHSRSEDHTDQERRDAGQGT